MNFPDRIFAVGGAGKEIALELLESEWVVNEVLEPRPNPTSLTVTIIDTAEGEENTDRQRIQDVRDGISETESRLREVEEGRTGNIDVEYKLITEDIHLSGSIDLVGEDAVPRITAGNGMDEEDWWIEDRHINENLDFAKGVVRKRGLGKAIYYKAYAEDDQISSYIDLPQKGKVAVLAGLGGGTGSGILIDLANHLQQKQRTAEITLFGILPNHTEGIKENTNAFAALSELEYDALMGDDVFKDRVLVPIDPTNFDGKTGNRIQTDKYLRELDEAVIYLLASYYNTQNLEDPFADTPQYAPFTVGVPQVLRYNVEAINEARDRFRNILAEKEEALQVEEEIYSRVDRFLTKNYQEGVDDVDAGLRDLDRTDLKERLEDAESWLEFDLFQELDYHSVGVFGDIISDAMEESEDLVDQIEILSGSLRAVDATDGETGTFVDNIDENLAAVLEKDLSLICRRMEILERRKAIDDNRIRDAVEYLIGIGDTNAAPGVKLQRLEAKLGDLEETLQTSEAQLEETIEELESIRDEQSSEIERRTDAWTEDVDQPVRALQQIDISTIEGTLGTLDTELEQFMRGVANAEMDDEVDRVDESEIADTLDRLARELEVVDVDFAETRRNVVGSLTELKKARKAFMTMAQEEGTLEKITPWESSTEEAKQEANRDFRIQRNNLNDKGIFEVGPPTGNFNVNYTFDRATLVETCREEVEDTRQSVVRELEGRVDEVSPDLRDSLEAELSATDPDIDALEEVARQVIRREVGETDEIEQRKYELEAKIETVNAELEVHSTAVDLFQQVNRRQETWSEKNEAFRTKLADHSNEPDHQVSTQEDEYVYVKNIKPMDIFRATGNQNIAESDLFSSQEENQRLRGNLEELAKNSRNQQYTGLLRRKLSKGHSRYSELKVRVAAMSPAIDQIDADALDFEDLFRGAFDLGASGKRVESPFTSWRKDIGGAWDISLSVFVTGVFLDNIRKVVQADGYHAGYEQQERELGDDVLIHHSHGLQDGFYVRRNSLLNMEHDDDVEFYLRDEDEVVDDLLSEYIDTVDAS